MSSVVLDASALLAFINDEPGGERVLRHLAEGACVASSVNIPEIVSRLVDRGGAEATISAIVSGLDIEIESFNDEDALSSGLLRAATRQAGLSLGDRACLALALKLGLPAVTADKAWTGLVAGVELELIR